MRAGSPPFPQAVLGPLPTLMWGNSAVQVNNLQLTATGYPSASEAPPPHAFPLLCFWG